MSHTLTLELPQEIYEPLAERAAEQQQSLEEWLLANLRQQTGQNGTQPNGDFTPDYRLRSHFGSVDLGAPTGTDNEQIDADLARVYGGDI